MSRQSYFKSNRRHGRAQRRGVLLLVVLSVLVLFMLIGTAFLVTSSQYRTSAKVLEKANRTTFQPGDLVERALMDVLRDTNNPYSAIRYHSLLRDAYGTDGFVAQVGVPTTSQLVAQARLAPRFAMSTQTQPMGPTNGQIIEFHINDTVVAANRPQEPQPVEVIGLERGANGRTVDVTLSKINGYYNGRLLTFLTGPLRGQTTRILDYTYDATSNAYGFRTLIVRRADGSALTTSNRNATVPEISEMIAGPNTATAVADDFLGHTFMVSGKPYNGTGVGFNALANIGGPRLSAVETFTDPGGTISGIETALLPNAVYFNPGATNIQSPNPIAAGNPFAGYNPGDNPFANLGTAYTNYEGPGGSDESYDAADYQNMFLAMQSVTPRARARVFEDTNPAAVTSENVEEHYSHGGDAPARLDLEDVTLPSFHRPDLVNFWFHRLYNSPWLMDFLPDPENRGKAILQPYNPTTGAPQYGLNPQMAALITGIKRRIMLRPLREDHPDFDGSNPLSRYANTAANIQNFEVVNTTTGQITFPAWEVAGPWDVDNDNDGIPDSVWVDIGLPVQKTEDGRFYKPLVAYLIQDMDGRLNLNAHGTAEDFAGRPIFSGQQQVRSQQINLDFNAPNDDPSTFVNESTQGLNLAGSFVSPQLRSTNALPKGNGWGPAEISLRSILSPLPLYSPGNSPPASYPYRYDESVFGRDFSDAAAPQLTIGNPAEDDYARLLLGRAATDSSIVGTYRAVSQTWGRYGSRVVSKGVNTALDAQSGVTFNPGNGNTIERHAPYDFYGYPQYDPILERRATPGYVPTSGFGEPADMRAAYSSGLDFRGQPVHEAALDIDRNFVAPGNQFPSILHDSPYELNIMSAARRDAVANILSTAASYGTASSVDDDAPFAPAELERILRAFDPDASRLPDRLWNLVDAFDAKKLVASISANPSTPNSAEVAQADLQAAINRRQVTTDSVSVPAPNDNWMSRIQFGADGYPGVAGFDDDNNSTVDDMSELNWANSDDYLAIMGALPNSSAGLVDYLRYRVVLELARSRVTDFNNNSQHDLDERVDGTAITAANRTLIQQQVNSILHGNNALASNAVRTARHSFGGLLSQETLAGLKMDLNRPFGDGRDNNGNGVVDEEQEAGEPWIDSDGNGTWNNEPYLDLDGDGRFYADTNNDGALTAADWRDFDNDGVTSPVVDSLWQQQMGAPVAFDHARGQDASASGRQVGANPLQNIIRDDARLARQLYARHLYCMMLLLVDENYLAPYDPTDPQMMLYCDPNNGKLTSGQPDASASMAYKLAFALGGASPTPAQKAEAKRRAMRKLTCRQIAQWAVNCVDMRDPDVIMTPFEYDENPWDGWNVVVTNPTIPADAALLGGIYPLDGDLVTDESNFVVRQYATNIRQVARVNRAGVLLANTQVVAMSPLDQTRGVVWGAERPELLMTEGLAWHDRRVEDLTIDRVGAPPPGGSATAPEDGGTIGSGSNPAQSDDDLDQRLRPQGACFVELYNPWSTDGQRPRDLYRYVDQNNDGAPDDLTGDGVADDSDGVKLDMVSAGQHPDGPSPVWRIAVLCDHPQLKNDTYNSIGGKVVYQGATSDDVGVNLKSSNNYSSIAFDSIATEQAPIGGPRIAQALLANRDASLLSAYPIPFRVPDNNFPGFRTDARPGQGSVVGVNGVRKRNVATSGISDPSVPGATGETHERFQFSLFGQQCYVERAFYPAPENPNALAATAPIDPLKPGYRVPKPRIEMVMTSPKNMPDTNMAGAVIPTEFKNKLYAGDDATTDARQLRTRKFYWSEGMRVITDKHPDDNTVNRTRAMFIGNRFMPSGTVVAPILPGRYGVVGTAGINHNATAAGNPAPTRWITTVGRQGKTDQKNGSLNDTFAKTNRLSSRRVELLPGLNPLQQQVVIDGNGGPELRRVAGQNVTTTGNVQPAVAIPITGMSISTPVDNYVLRRFELDELDRDFDFARANGEGEFMPLAGAATSGTPKARPYDAPFDTDPELILNQTTPNYRTVTLERLANPLLPWNPPPGEEEHDPAFPVNPYLAIDAMPLDLTAFNGASEQEGNNSLNGTIAAGDPSENLHRTVRKMPNKVTTGMQDFPRFSLRSVERTSHNEFWYPDGATNIAAWETAPKTLLQPARTQWGQSQPKFNRMIDDLRFDVELDVFDLDNDGSTTEVIPDAVYTGGGSISDRYKSLAIALQPKPHFVDYPLMCTLGYGPQDVQVAIRTDKVKSSLIARTARAESLVRTSTGNYFDATRANVDANGDGTPGDLVGGPQINTANNDVSRPDRSIDDSTNPYFTWNNRPFANEGELLQVPAASPARMLAYYSTFNANAPAQANAYTAGDLGVEQNPASVTTAAQAFDANKARWDRQHAPFGHLLNALQTSAQPCRVTVAGAEIVATGAPNFARILDYVHVPSKFVATDLMMSPTTFQGEALAATDPRANFSAPFNRVAEYREPGKVNLNTAVGRRTDSVNSWSEVYDGVMHRVRDDNFISDPNNTPGNRNDDVLQAIGHLGPAWRDVVMSRRGYVDPTIIAAGNLDSSPMTLNPFFPSVVSNPFRSADASDLVPLQTMVQTPAEASVLRSHPFSPGPDNAWGERQVDDAWGSRLRNMVVDDADEAGRGDDALMQDNTTGGILAAAVTPDLKSTRVPLFSGATLEPSLDTERNPAFRYGPIQRLSSMTTTRSGVFAVWITVGFFEVKPISDTRYDVVRNRYNLNDVAQRALFDRIYPEGYTLGKELGSDTGDTHRHRAFYLVDRTLPVAFKPGEDLNVDKAVLVRRRIE